eukprot:20976-Hanusia_phi.AAC.1
MARIAEYLLSYTRRASWMPHFLKANKAHGTFGPNPFETTRSASILWPFTRSRVRLSASPGPLSRHTPAGFPYPQSLS